MQTKLFRRDFTLVVIGQIISLFGNAVLRFALPLSLLRETGSPSLFGAVSACSFAPMVLLSLVGGVLADRVNKRNIMVGLDFSTAALLLLFSLLLGRLPAVPLFIGVLMLLYGISGTYQPAVQASVPLLVSGDRLMAGNAVINQVNTLSGLLGPVIGGVMFTLWGIVPILLLSAICFTLSAIMELFIHIPHQTRPRSAGVLRVIGADLRECLRFVRTERPVFFSVACLAALFNPGDRIAAEQLSYPLLRHLAQRLRLQIVPIRMDKNGIIPSAFETACRTRAIRGVYLMPSCHNPTLSLIPEFRRREIVAICRRYDVCIIEDDVYALSLEQHLPPLSRLAPERSCFIASTSEALGAGLRIAYLCAPTHFVQALEHTISYTVSMAPPLMAELAALWIGDGTADSVLVAKRKAAHKANELARSKLDGFELVTRTTGFFCWLKLPGGPEEATAFAQAATRQGIIVADVSYFAVGGQAESAGVRLALGLRDQDVLSGALECLARILQRG